MNKKLRNFLLTLLQAVGIAAVVIFIVCPLSCHISPEGIDFITGDYETPKILGYKVIDNKHLSLEFSEAVNVSAVVVNRKDNLSSLNNDGLVDVINVSHCDDKDEVVFELGQSTTVGGEYLMGGVVEDTNGNSLTFSLPFVGYNSNIPPIIIPNFLMKQQLFQKLPINAEMNI